MNTYRLYHISWGDWSIEWKMWVSRLKYLVHTTLGIFISQHEFNLTSVGNKVAIRPVIFMRNIKSCRLVLLITTLSTLNKAILANIVPLVVSLIHALRYFSTNPSLQFCCTRLLLGSHTLRNTIRRREKKWDKFYQCLRSQWKLVIN